MYPNVPHTPEDREAMLAELGLDGVEALFAPIPAPLRAQCAIDDPRLPAQGLSEDAAERRLAALAAKNQVPGVTFRGAGAYDHYVPASVDHILRRSEFLTAYTPYQPEVAQGSLQVIFEFQSLVAALTGMEVANASLYDGASGTAEACLLALADKRLTQGGKIAVSAGLDPRVRRVLATYLEPTGTELVEVPLGECGRTSPQPEHLEGAAAFVLQSPNLFGVVEELKAMGEAAHGAGALMVVNTNPVSLGLLEAPGKLGADVVVGDAICFGNARSYGGPGLGIFAVQKKHMRKVPGRLAGMTKDGEGRRAYVLTLQAREQHIRRARATSNICTNQGLNAVAATVHMALLGREGLTTMARACYSGARYLRGRLTELDGFSLVHSAPTFHEFALRCPLPARVAIEAVRETTGIEAGFDLGRLDPAWDDQLLIAVTERRTREECDALVAALKEVAA